MRLLFWMMCLWIWVSVLVVCVGWSSWWIWVGSMVVIMVICVSFVFIGWGCMIGGRLSGF